MTDVNILITQWNGIIALEKLATDRAIEAAVAGVIANRTADAAHKTVLKDAVDASKASDASEVVEAAARAASKASDAYARSAIAFREARIARDSIVDK